MSTVCNIFGIVGVGNMTGFDLLALCLYEDFHQVCLIIWITRTKQSSNFQKKKITKKKVQVSS